ncbi:hypothetical protein Godav_028862, partial [Gossypium davidsonii]|nr:hypothetical protein [Gossypium davidsonii]
MAEARAYLQAMAEGVLTGYGRRRAYKLWQKKWVSKTYVSHTYQGKLIKWRMDWRWKDGSMMDHDTGWKRYQAQWKN